MPYEVAQFLDAAILARKSMVISGDQGAGKTTLLRALIKSIPLNERFGTLETDYELMTHLQPGRENILALQARVGHGETSGGSRVGDFTISDLYRKLCGRTCHGWWLVKFAVARPQRCSRPCRPAQGQGNYAPRRRLLDRIPVLNATRSQRGERGRLDLRRGIGSGPLDVGVGRVSSRAAATDGVSSTSSSLINSSGRDLDQQDSSTPPL